MIRQRRARPLALLAAGAILLAACGSDTNATPSPATNTLAPATLAPPVTQAPPTQAPIQTFVIPSFALPSGGGDLELEAMFPASIGGVNVMPFSVTGDQMAASPYASLLKTFVEAQDKTLADASVAVGGASGVTIIAYRVRGVPAEETLDYLITLTQQIAPGVVTDETVAGKAVRKMTPAAAGETPTYSYAHDDVVFVIGGDALTAALLTETLSQLP